MEIVNQPFVACVEKYISESKSRRFEEEINTKVKLDVHIYIYKRLGKSVKIKKH